MVLEATSAFLDSPLMVMGIDFTLIAESGMAKLPERARLFLEDGVNMEYMNALLQDEGWRALSQSAKTTLFPAYISGFPSLNRNLYIDGQLTHRLVPGIPVSARGLLLCCRRPGTDFSEDSV